MSEEHTCGDCGYDEDGCFLLDAFGREELTDAGVICRCWKKKGG